MTAVSFIVAGPPVQWKRAMRGAHGSFTDPDVQRYQRAIAFAFLGAVKVPWPKKARYRVHTEVAYHDERRRDIDNMGKQVLDALNGVAWEDDSQVDILHVERLSVSRDAPQLSVTIEVIE